MSIKQLLAEFFQHAQPFGATKWSHHHDGGQYAHTLVISGLIHGNETGSLPAIIETIKALNSGKIKHGGQIIFTLGNPEAALKNVRFLRSDLNRVFLETPLETHEAMRARELMPIFDQADVLIDLHQTILDTQQPFYIFPWTEQSGLWAKAMGVATVCVDATPDPSKPIMTQCADDYVRALGKPAITIELGEKGINESSHQIAVAAISKAIDISAHISHGTGLHRLIAQDKKLTIYVTAHREAHGDVNRRLKPGLINFMPVVKGEKLNAADSPSIIAPLTGMILFPKYPPPGKALPKKFIESSFHKRQHDCSHNDAPCLSKTTTKST